VTTTLPHARLSRGRRSARPSGDDRELAILATAERLLEDRPLADISVDDLAKGAGISRPTFYFYFASKEAVLLTLLDRVGTEADTALERLGVNADGDRHKDRDDMWRTGINVFFETFRSHKGVTRASWAARESSAEVRQLWSIFMQKWITHTAAVIEVERARGAAPETLPAGDLATALNLMNERALFASFANEPPSVPEARVLETLVHIWVTSIYGDPRTPAPHFPT
jgi:AcrR family transcriptional regulator